MQTTRIPLFQIKLSKHPNIIQTTTRPLVQIKLPKQKKLGFFSKKEIDKYDPNYEKFKFFTSLDKNIGDAPLKSYTKEVIDNIQQFKSEV